MINVDFGIVAFSESVRIVSSASSNLVDANYFAGLGVDDGDDWERISPEVAFAVLAVGSIDKGLHVSAVGVISCVEATIWPRLNDDFEALGEVELGDALLKDGGVSADNSDVIELFATGTN